MAVKARESGVAIRAGDTPVPIPNTTVKAGTAESTALETVWEGRWLRQSKKETSQKGKPGRLLS